MSTDFLFGMVVGLTVGVYITLEWAWRKFLSKPPTIELKADRKAIESIAACNVSAWLDMHGLVKMPKGVDFHPSSQRGQR